MYGGVVCALHSGPATEASRGNSASCSLLAKPRALTDRSWHVGCLCILEEMSIQTLCPFLSGWFVFVVEL